MLKILNIFKMPQGHKESHKKTVSGGWHIWEHKPEWGAEVGQLVSVRWRGGRNSLLYQLTFILLFTNKSCAETKMTGFYLQTSGWHACKTERDLQCLQHILQLRRFGGTLLRSPWIPPQSSFWVFILGCQQWASQYGSSIVPSETNIFHFATWGQQNNL